MVAQPCEHRSRPRGGDAHDNIEEAPHGRGYHWLENRKDNRSEYEHVERRNNGCLGGGVLGVPDRGPGTFRDQCNQGEGDAGIEGDAGEPDQNPLPRTGSGATPQACFSRLLTIVCRLPSVRSYSPSVSPATVRSRVTCTSRPKVSNSARPRSVIS